MSLRLVVGCMALAAMLAMAAGGQTEPLLVRVRNVPAHGLAMARVSLAALPADRALSATMPDGTAVPVQVVPDAGAGATGGTLVLRLPRAGDAELTLTPGAAPQSAAGALPDVPGGGAALRFAAQAMGGLPSAITFAGSGRRVAAFAWNDRVYDPNLGSFLLRLDPSAKPEIVSQGSVATVVRVRARYVQEGGKQPPSQPEAVYDWFVFRDLPVVYVRATVRQREPFSWSELHFLELNMAGGDFSHWAGGDPAQRGEVTGSQKSTRVSSWAALTEGREAVGLFGTPIIVYEGKGGYGTYLHSTWTQWGEREAHLGAWLWLGSAEDPAAAVQAAAAEYPGGASAVVMRAEMRRQVTALRAQAGKAAAGLAADLRMRAALAERAETEGRLALADTLAKAGPPTGWTLRAAGDLGLALEKTDGGVDLASLYDLRAQREMLGAGQPPLFSITLHSLQGKETAAVAADAGWKAAAVKPGASGLTIRWEQPDDSRLRGLAVTATATPDARSHAWRWSLAVTKTPKGWSVSRVVFPQLSLAEPGEDAAVLYPAASGVVDRNAWHRGFSYRGSYPSGWCALQMMAVYGRGGGLYVGIHDPYGSTKVMTAEGRADERSVRLTYEHPAPDMGRADNGFTLGGPAVWQLLRGDWYDAAMIYRAWAKREAKWWPKLGPNGREDTPLWMRELPAWAQTGGTPAECVGPVKAFQQYLGVPVGFHWYSWHEIPFDNDYPHYFPTKPGVAEGVKELQAANVFVMPYINGRLWDTRDRGLEDYQFTSVALPAVTKDEDGKPYTESYGSKESDGSPVRLGVMCPTTTLWQDTIRSTVLRIMNEVGTKAVYIDQVAAADPTLCQDPSHGHPLGGGHWWTEGYWKLIGGIRAAKPADRMITTECNAEPFVNVFDGYLTWHWQYDGQVPLFPAVYGGAVQMFGRNYAGGATRDLALRMKAGQQLVFGEQIGWLAPGVINEPGNAEFFRRVVQLRYRYRRFFYAGEMARPPHLAGPVPTVRADWQWGGGEDWVTTDAVLTGAWRLPKERRMALFFVNVSDQPVDSDFTFDPAAYGIPAGSVTLTASAPPEKTPARFTRRLTVPAREAVVWEVEW